MPGPKLFIKEWLPIEKFGAKCMRERGASSALPLLYFLHVWWESLGVRLGLLLLALKPLRKTRRMGDICEKVQGMTEEQVYYWFSKVTQSPTAGRSQRAVRVILRAEE